MKNFSFFLLLLCGILSAQIVNIPDANFKAKLLEADTSNDIAKNEFGYRIKVDANNDGEIQVSEALLVYYLEIGNSEINNLYGINFFENLVWIYCGNNYLQNLDDFEGMSNLATLQCPDNHFTELEFPFLPEVTILNVGGNLQMTSIDFEGLPKVYHLTCNYNPMLEHIDFSPLVKLSIVQFSYNPVQDVDFSNNYFLSELSVNSDDLRYLNIKNGSSYFKMTDFNTWDIPENTFICADPSDLTGFNFQYLPESSQISIYCSSYNGANYNTIKGAVSLDINSNGNCNTELTGDSFLKVKVSDGISDFYAFTNSGNYEVYMQEGEFSVSPQLIENSELFTFTPTVSVVNFSEANSNVEVRDFCLTPVGESKDVEIIIYPIEPARPGFDAVYKVFYRNKGNQTVSGNIIFDFFGDLMDFVSSDTTPHSQTESNLTFDFENLLPFENREITLRFNINAPTDTPAVNIGDWLSFEAEIEIPEDVFDLDNDFTLRQEVVGSFDPNDILCLQGNLVDPEMIGEELHYRIRFENTGNYPAERVVVAMPINPEDYDVSSFQLLNTSHEVQARVVNNTAEFFFENINLAPNGEGFILFSAKSLETLEIGDSVMSYADIYFDYNFPITTNEEVTIFEIMETNESSHQPEVQVYPNPTRDFLNIKSDSKINSIEIYDQSGKLIKVAMINSFDTKQNFSSFPSAIYFIKIQTESGIKIQKIIKQ